MTRISWLPTSYNYALSLPGHPSAFLGTGIVGTLGSALRSLEARRVLVIGGGPSYTLSGASAAIDKLRGRFLVEEISGVRPNPTWESVITALEVARSFRPEAVVGIGGGSVMDTAKVIACLCDSAGQEVKPGSRPSRPRTARLLLAPTIPGSGAEMTGFATIYVANRKTSFTSMDSRADLVLIDPDLALSLPKPNLAVSTLDGVCQAVESWWAVGASESSRQLSRAGLKHLLRGLRFGDDGTHERSASISRLALGASIVGSAINAANTTAAHALSYWLTGFKGIPHGVAVGVNMPWLFTFNYAVSDKDCRHPMGPAFVMRVVNDVDSLCCGLAGAKFGEITHRLLTLGGGPVDLIGIGLGLAEWKLAIADALSSDRSLNNPREFGEQIMIERFLRESGTTPS